MRYKLQFYRPSIRTPGEVQNRCIMLDQALTISTLASRGSSYINVRFSVTMQKRLVGFTNPH